MLQLVDPGTVLTSWQRGVEGRGGWQMNLSGLVKRRPLPVPQFSHFIHTAVHQDRQVC